MMKKSIIKLSSGCWS